MGETRIAELDQLVAKLRDEDEVVRYRAVCDIGDRRHEAEWAIPALLTTLDDPDEEVVAAAAAALGMVVRPWTASDEVIDRLSDLIWSPDDRISEIAEWALSELEPEDEDTESSCASFGRLLAATAIVVAVGALLSWLNGRA